MKPQLVRCFVCMRRFEYTALKDIDHSVQTNDGRKCMSDEQLKTILVQRDGIWWKKP